MTIIQRENLTESELDEIFEYGTLNGIIVEWDDHYTQVTLIED